MFEWLPEQVVEAIQRHYREAVSKAESVYTSSMEDEDSVTGALGQAMTEVNGSVTVSDTGYTWRTTYRKFRGRGRGATEKLIGADGIFEMEVLEAGGDSIGRKALLFQAKNNWQGRDRRLIQQAARLSELKNGAIVVNYTRQGYFAVPAEIISEAEGNRSRLPPHAESPLGDVLADKFVPCTIGRRDLYYDAQRRQLVYVADGEEIRTRHLPVGHRVRTTVRRHRTGCSTSAARTAAG